MAGRLCDDDDSHWPEPGPSGVEPPSSIEVDLPDEDEQVLYGPDGSVLLTLRRPFGFAAWRGR